MINVETTKEQLIVELEALRQRVAELETVEAERKQVEEALRESERKYKLLFESTLDGMFVLDAETMKIVLANQAAAKIYGFDSAEDAVGTKPLDFVLPEDRERVIRIIAEDMFAKDLRQVNEFRTITKDGREIWISAVGTRTEYQGKLAGLVSFSDITERKRAEEALRESEEKLDAMLRSIGDHMSMMDKDLNIIWANETARKIFGNDIIGKKCYEVYHRRKEPCEPYPCLTLKAFQDGEVHEHDTQVIDKDGEIIYFHCTANVALRDKEGKPTAVIEISRDITERKRAEEALQESREELRKMFESATDGISVIDLNGVITEVNKEAVRMHGFNSKDELLGKSAFELVAPRDHERIAANMQKALKQETIKGIEYTLLKADGSEFPGELSTSVLKDASGNSVGHITISRDITERKRAEEALRESERKYRVLFESTLDGMFVLDAETMKIVLANQAAAKIYGFDSAEDAVGTKPLDFVPPEDRERVIRIIAEDMFAKDLRQVNEFRTITKDGREIWISALGIRTEYQGRLAGLVSIRDITERRQAEEALELQEAYFQQLFDNSPDAIAMLDDTDRVVQVNKGFETLFGYRAEEVKGRFIDDIVVPEDRIEEASALFRAALNGEVSRIETVRKRKDGSLVDVSLLDYPIQFGNKTVGVYAVYSDITERKRAEEALERQQAYFQQLFDNSPEGIALLDDTDRVVQVNKGFETLFGYRAEEVKDRFLYYMVVPEDRIEEASALARAALNNQVSRIETVRKRKDGSLVDISLLHYPIQFGNQTVAVYAIYSDITERKRAAEALELQKAYFQQLFDNSPDAIAMLGDTGRVVQVNWGFEALFGYRAEEVKGWFINDMVVPEDRIEEASALFRAALNGEVSRIETVRKRKDGSLVDVSLLDYPIQFGNQTVGEYAIYSDITERKEMEQQLILTDRLASVGELVSGIAHELNNPLTGVIGFSQLLLDKDVSDDVKLDLKIIYSEAQRAADVVKGLLTFARKHVPVKQPVNIDSIIEKVLTLRAYEQRVNNIQVNTYFAPDLPEVMADHFQLQQVFLNIIINAEYFMVEAHHEGTLTITTEKVGDIIKASVTDDGPGINQENLGHLFDPFFTTKEVGKGTGLGLSICHGVITEHGGQIYAESELGKGTTFVVELPISDHW